jgi:hypothetical protein
MRIDGFKNTGQFEIGAHSASRPILRHIPLKMSGQARAAVRKNMKTSNSELEVFRIQDLLSNDRSRAA